MKTLQLVVAGWCLWVGVGPVLADSVASVEPIASTAVVNIEPFLEQDLEVRAVFAGRLLECGIVEDVERLLWREHVTPTVNERNVQVQLSVGGFAGNSNPTYAFTVDDTGRNAVSHDDILRLTDSLGYVMSQDSIFVLDLDNPASFEFPASYVVLQFRRTPPLGGPAALFETVGRIDPQLFETDTSGYTQVGRSYISLQSDVPEEEFVAGYVQAAREFGVRYTPVVDGAPAVFDGGAGFPGNDWVAHPAGEEYLSRIPGRVHEGLRRLRAAHLDFTRRALRQIRRHDPQRHELLRTLEHLDCR
jgi:hypothetical protein